METIKDTKSISKTEMLQILSEVEKSTFINLVTETSVRMNKTGNKYYNRIKKLSSCNFLTGNSYEDRVRSNEEKEGLTPDFVSKENSVGSHISKCVLFNQNTNSYYLMVERFDEIKPQVEYKEITDEGEKIIEKMMFEDFMVKSSPIKTQDQERKVMVLSYKLDSIKEFSLGGVKYVVE